MFGKSRKGNGYYTCQPKLDLVGKPEEYADRPRSVYVREDKLLECVEKFSTSASSAPTAPPCRTTLPRHQLRGQSSSKGNEIAQRITAIRKTVAEITRRQDNVLDERESSPITSGDDLVEAWDEQLRRRCVELEQQRRTKTDELKSLREQSGPPATPTKPPCSKTCHAWHYISPAPPTSCNATYTRHSASRSSTNTPPNM